MKIALIAFVLLFCGCSTVPLEYSPISGSGIQIVRDSGFVNSGCVYDIQIDHALVGQLSQGQRIAVPTSPGEHIVTIKNASAICPNIITSKRVTTTTQYSTLRIGVAGGGSFQVFFDEL